MQALYVLVGTNGLLIKMGCTYMYTMSYEKIYVTNHNPCAYLGENHPTTQQLFNVRHTYSVCKQAEAKALTGTEAPSLGNYGVSTQMVE